MKKRFEFRNQVIDISFADEQPADPVEVCVYDQIGKDPWTGGGISASDFRSMLNEVCPGRDRALNILINSKGGDVHEGFSIRNELGQWPKAVTATITGIAASTASWLMPKNAKVRAFKASQIFVHDAVAFGVGNAQDFRSTAERLDKTSAQIAAMYAERSGRRPGTMRALMTFENFGTLMTGEEALAERLVDEVIDGEPVRNFLPEELNAMRDQIQAMNNSARQRGGGQPTTPNTMNKKKVIAMLNKHGITVINGAAISDETPDEQLEAALNQLFETKNNKAADAPSNVVPAEELTKLRKELEQLTEANNAARKLRITNEVEALISNDQIPANLRDKVIARAMKDDEYLNELKALPSKPPGAEPVKSVVLEKNASAEDLAKAFNAFSEPMQSWRRGNSVSMNTIGRASMARGQFFKENKQRLTDILNVGSNTIPAGLQKNVILSEIVVDFARRIIPLRAFATNFGNIPLEGTAKAEVRYYDLDAGASTSWVTATGYAAGDTTTAVKEIQIGNNGGNAALLCDRKYQGLSFTSEEMVRQPYFDVLTLAKLKAEKLASDIITHVLSVITNANYGAAALTIAAAAVSPDDIADLKLACKLWPDVGRSLWLDSAYDAALLKDSSIKAAMNFGGPEAIRNGQIPRLFGFDYFENPTIPANGENLVGFAAFKSAIGYAQAPVPPAAGVRNSGTTYEIYTDPVSGVSMEYRTFGDNTLDAEKHFIEASYGFAVLNGNAIKRITSA